MLYGLALIILGVLSASSLIVSKRPDAKAVIEKLAPHQGWIGLVGALWGAWGVIKAVLHIGLIAHAPLWWFTWLAISLVTLANGFLLGFNLGMAFVSDEKAKARATETYQRLAPHQTRLGLIAIALGVWGVLIALVH